MKSRPCGGKSVFLAFTAHLLEVDFSPATAVDAPSRHLPFKSSSLRRSSLSRRASHRFGAFVHQMSVSVKPPGGRSAGSPRSLSGAWATVAEIRKQRIARRVTRCVTDPPSAVASRHYADSSSSKSSDNFMAYWDPNVDDEFSLFWPHLEFSELALWELSSGEPSCAGSNPSSSFGVESPEAPSSALSSSSQLYGDFEEVEIGHFRLANGLNEPQANDGRGSNSPFFFASFQKEESRADSKNRRTPPEKAPTEENIDPVSPTLPPWYSLNQARFAPMKLRKLRRHLGPHLSSKEVERVVSAIRMASGGDMKKVAGAAYFCSILVNSLELTDVPALCAAAFHSSLLVSVRERELKGITEVTHSIKERPYLQTDGPDAEYLCTLAGSGVENFGAHTLKIALDAARLKSMEMLAVHLLRRNGKPRPLRSANARNLRSLLLTVNKEGDWRALAVRSAACLYRLEGLEAHRSLLSTVGGQKTRTRVVTLEESRTSQEALHIHAPLAARLGMFRLKTELEDAAFRTLYPRSHAKVWALSGGGNTNYVGEGMKSVLGDISRQMKRLVHEDCSFMENIELVSVTARVKEPYSVWKKMLKISKDVEGVNVRDLSILDIPDALAIRVVFAARKLTPNEPDAMTKCREKELCYYLYDLCTRNWPESSGSCFKDYVNNPKENGYQSLHYSTRKRWRGTEWPFEVQIRSAGMHRVAEYGVAAHWSYKRHDVDGETPSATHTYRGLDRTSEAYLKSVQEWRTKQAARSYVEPDPQFEEPALFLEEEEIRRQRKKERDEMLAPYLEALSGAQTDMTRENVFVFISVRPHRKERSWSGSPSFPSPTEGTVLSLPAGSRVLDAIRATEKWSSALKPSGHLYDGRSSFVALRNGMRTSSMGTELLASGDVVSIIPTNDLILLSV